MQYIDYYNYYYEYSTPVYTSPVASIASLAINVLLIVAMWMIFKKAGKPGWAAIVPFYNIYTMYEITWGSGWRFLMLLIPFYNIVLAIQTQIKLAKAFGKSGGFAVGLIFLPYVFNPILGFDGSTYLGVPGSGRRGQQEGYAPNSGDYQQPEPEFQVTFCPNCGAKVNGGKFCENCGKPL